MTQPTTTTPFESSREACEDDRVHGETTIPVTDAAWHESVRPAGWPWGYATLLVEDLDADHVRVLWRCDRRDDPPEASTVFARSEYVNVR